MKHPRAPSKKIREVEKEIIKIINIVVNKLLYIIYYIKL